MSEAPTTGGRRLASGIGAGAVLLWATLALATTALTGIPTFQLTAMAFAIAAMLAVVKWVVRGEAILPHLAHPWPVWALGLGGLFGYHVCYFAAFAAAPAVEVNLINYLWPLLIVVLSSLLPGERLRWWHLAGAIAGLAGTALLIGGRKAGFDPAYIGGYLLAVAAAFVWSSYSVLSRRFGSVPTDSIGGFCAGTAVLAFLVHLAFETWRWPQGWQWLIVLWTGLGPVGSAFYLWDHGVKHGDIRALGAMSYAIPLMSTLLLIAFGRAEASVTLGLSCLLIVGGAVLAARDLWQPEGAQG